MDPRVDIEKLDRLVQMRDRIAADRARAAFNTAMAAVQAELPQVVRRADNSQTKSRYATLESIGDAIDPIITAHGFSMSFAEEDCPKEGHYRTICDVALGAHERRYHIDLPIDGTGMKKGNANKTATHAFKSTMTYSRRILTELIFNVKTKNNDDDGNVAGAADAPTISEEQILHIRDLLEAEGRNEARFLQSIGLSSLDAMYASKYDDAISMIKRVAAMAKGAKS